MTINAKNFKSLDGKALRKQCEMFDGNDWNGSKKLP